MTKTVPLQPIFCAVVKMNWRKRLYNTLESKNNSVYSRIYAAFMFICIIVSIIPLAFREQNIVFDRMERIAVTVFIIDYLLRWMTADYQLPHRSKLAAFLLYPITPFAIIDLLSILPSFIVVHKALKLLRITRMFKILRVFKFIRYSQNVQMLFRVLKKERRILFTVFWIAIFYIIVTALIMFNVEDSAMFETYFDALYWATTTLTTVGYGDIYPATNIGRLISMFSAIFGVAVIALPSGVITASYLQELKESKKKNEEEKETKTK